MHYVLSCTCHLSAEHTARIRAKASATRRICNLKSISVSLNVNLQITVHDLRMGNVQRTGWNETLCPLVHVSLYTTL